MHTIRIKDKELKEDKYCEVGNSVVKWKIRSRIKNGSKRYEKRKNQCLTYRSSRHGKCLAFVVVDRCKVIAIHNPMITTTEFIKNPNSSMQLM